MCLVHLLLTVDYTWNQSTSSMDYLPVGPSVGTSRGPSDCPGQNHYPPLRRWSHKMQFALIFRVVVLLLTYYLASRIMADRLFRRYTQWKIECPKMEDVGDIDAVRCASECIQRTNCTGFNYYRMTTEWNICELCYANLSTDISLSPPTNSTAYAFAGKLCYQNVLLLCCVRNVVALFLYILFLGINREDIVSVCLSVCKSIFMSVYLSVYLSIYLSIYLTKN